MLDEVNSGDFDLQDAEYPKGLEVEQSDEATDLVIADWEPIRIGSEEFDVQEAEDLAVSDSNGIYGGIIRDIESLERAIEALGNMRREEVRRFLARGITSLFIIWTVLGLVILVATGSSWLLLSDAGPATLFGLVVHYYFRK